MDANEIEVTKLRLQAQELELKRTQLAIEFAKFGFRGTLAGGFAGLILILALALLSARYPNFEFGTYGVLGTSLLLVVATGLFGALSLRQPLKMLTELGKLKFTVDTSGSAP